MKNESQYGRVWYIGKNGKMLKEKLKKIVIIIKHIYVYNGSSKVLVLYRAQLIYFHNIYKSYHSYSRNYYYGHLECEILVP